MANGDTVPEKVVPRLVEEQSTLRPDALAVADSDETLSYRQLNDRAEIVANHLRSLGVGPDSPVALCLQGSLAMVVGALGIMKAGGAYLPLDLAYPKERISSILKDAQVPALVTAESLANTLPQGSWQVIELDAQGNLTDSEPAFGEPPLIEPTLDNLAYIIYTSGSTGQPKGVEITHRGLLNLIQWHQNAFAVTPQDRASQIAGVGFDAAVWELWPYLTAGASIQIAGEAARTEPEALREWLLSREITIGFIPTLMTERLMALDWPSKAPLRIVLTGADTLHHYPSSKLPFLLVNNYGPTECTVVTTSGPVFPNERPNQRPTIGKPIANMQVYILNENLKKVPTGTAGEIHIGGAQLARGYLSRPELTDEKFIPNPFSEQRGARLYKTGDLGCYLPDGQIAFLGRIDDQIKIRGYRIEPNEIVSVLNQHPAIQESAVIAREFAPGDKRLIAYIVAVPEEQPAYGDLRSFVGTRLPEYMVPTTFVKLRELPVNSSGKVDRSALPAPDQENTLRTDDFIAPRTMLEQRVADILAPLLGLEQMSVEDNFFLLGGHSLLGTQLIARIRDSFSVALTLRTLFEAPTVAQLASEIERLLIAKLENMSDEDVERLLNVPNEFGASVNVE